MTTDSLSAPKPIRLSGRHAVGLWLVAICVLLAAMVMVGGLTRLTNSGLSITEWRPVTGVVPPLNPAAWQEAFERYQQIPEYKALNAGMSLAAFKTIYWWEWTHRLLGRLIGLAFLVPFVAFVLMRTISAREMPRFLGLFVLGGAQGALGWFMVKSGLTHRTDVSQYRLAAHLALAFVIYGAMLWSAFDYLRRPPAARTDLPWPVTAVAAKLVALVFLQVILGAFVAGLDAGFTYNTWPLMDGRFVPAGLGALSPWWRNLFENITTVQFAHRMMAYIVFATALWIFAEIRFFRGLKKTPAATSAHIVLAAVTLQIGLGIATLLAVVPVALGALHQLGALAVFSTALYHLHTLVGRPKA